MSRSKRTRKTITAVKVYTTSAYNNNSITQQINKRPEILRNYENTIIAY